MYYLMSFLNQVCGFHLRLSPAVATPAAAAAPASAQFCVYAARLRLRLRFEPQGGV